MSLNSEVMKKVVTAVVLVAFAGAVAFASFETNKKTTKNKQEQQKQEKKEIKKKKSCSHTCLFS